jgi:hypothetical protein
MQVSGEGYAEPGAEGEYREERGELQEAMTSPGDWCARHNDTVVGPYRQGRRGIRNRTLKPVSRGTREDQLTSNRRIFVYSLIL